jgi:hypothetical protein
MLRIYMASGINKKYDYLSDSQIYQWMTFMRYFEFDKKLANAYATACIKCILLAFESLLVNASMGKTYLQIHAKSEWRISSILLPRR